MPKIIYQKFEDNKWIRSVFSKQCQKNVFSGQCQGKEGHKGDHWRYGEDGSYHWRVNEKEKNKRSAGGMTPPGHEGYVSPIQKHKDYYFKNAKIEEVTDIDLIKKLENDEINDDNIMIIKPVVSNNILFKKKGHINYSSE